MNKALVDYAIYGSYDAKINNTKTTSNDQCTGLSHYRSDLEQGCKNIGVGWVNDPTKDVYNPKTACVFDNGYFGTCVLKEAHGDPTKCCIGGTSQTESAACPSTYIDNRFSSSSCRDKWQNVCRPEDFVDSGQLCATDSFSIFGQTFSVDGCKPNNPCYRYAQNNPTDSYVVSRLSGYCSNNLTKPECRTFCLANPGACDSGVQAYCKRSDKDTQFCSCVTSPAAAYDGLNPVCVDNDCKTSASYRTAAMKQINQCVSVNCNIIQNLTAGGNFKFTDNVIKQNCGASGPGTSTPANPVPDGSNPVVDTTIDTPNTPIDVLPITNYPGESIFGMGSEIDMAIIGGILFVIFAIIIVLFMVFSGGKGYDSKGLKNRLRIARSFQREKGGDRV